MVRPRSVVTYFLFDSIKIESETLYRYRYDYQDGHLRWARESHAGDVYQKCFKWYIPLRWACGFHAGTVDEGDLP